MGLQTIEGLGVPFPQYMGNILTSLQQNAGQINAAGEKIAWILRATKAGTIQRVGFMVSTVTTSGDFDVRLEGVNTSGEPDGTLLDVSAEVSPYTISSNGWKWADFGGGNGATVAVGDLIAVVVQDNASSAPDVTFVVRVNADATTGFPYQTQFLTGSWVHISDGAPVFALEFDDGTVMPGIRSWPVNSNAAIAFNSADSPDERGLIFQLPVRCRVTGAWIQAGPRNDCDVKLYDSDGTTVLETVSIDPDVRNANGANTLGLHWLEFSASHVLEADTNYRLTLLPGASDIDAAEWGVDSAHLLNSFPGGAVCHHTSRTDGGSWTEDTARRPMMGVVIDQFNDGIVSLFRQSSMSGLGVGGPFFQDPLQL